MLFKKKSSKDTCTRCKGSLNEDFSFCPYCGVNLISKEEMERDYGLLGKNDAPNKFPQETTIGANLGITDKLINNMFNMVMKNINQQMREDIGNAEISQMPNGIKISIGQPQKRKTHSPKIVRKNLTEEQLKKIASLPRKEAKSTMRRLPDSVVYELTTPGISSTEDIFISKLESGYEVKALGDKNMYVNSLQVNLPLRGVAIDKNKVIVEFKTQQE